MNNPTTEAARVNKGFDVGHCEHTPGPWTVKSTADSCKYTKDWREISPGVVAAASYDTTRWGEMETTPGVRITEANARLIAAAPELLDIMRSIANETRCYEDGPRSYSGDSYLPEHFKAGIRAVIAKAEGRSC